MGTKKAQFGMAQERACKGVLFLCLPSQTHAVTHAMTKTAVETGAVRQKLDDDYFENTNILKPPWM
jgi:hypothetical protein